MCLRETTKRIECLAKVVFLVYNTAMNIKTLCILWVVVASFVSCKYLDYGLTEAFGRSDTINDRAKYKDITDDAEISSLKTLNGKYKFLLVSDVHFGGEDLHDNGKRRDGDFFTSFKAHFDDATSEGVPIKFCICLGDTAEHGYKKEMVRYNTDFVGKLKSDFAIPTLTVPGNHDLYNSGYDDFRDTTYPHTSFYHFSTTAMSYYFLDSASCMLGAEQLSTLRGYLHTDSKRPLVFMHIPIFAEGCFTSAIENTTERNKIISIFNKEHVLAVFSGHTHLDFKSDLGRFNEYTIAGYLQRRAYYIITVDEGAGSISKQKYTY